jgi:hypothetical protein
VASSVNYAEKDSEDDDEDDDDDGSTPSGDASDVVYEPARPANPEEEAQM